MIDILLQIVVAIASVVILIHAEPALNRMDKKAPLGIRAAFHTLTIAAVLNLGMILLGWVPKIGCVFMAVAIALFLHHERRWRQP